MSGSNRREFLGKAVLMGSAAAAWRAAAAQTAGEKQQADLIGRMKWMNEPASFKREGEKLIVRTRPKTDFWRRAPYTYTTDNGHFFYLPVTGDFIFEARIAGNYSALYDQAGLMVRLDAENWMKCGTELVNGDCNASVVFTRQFSDWATIRNPYGDAPVWWRALRKKESLQTLYSLNGKDWVFVRDGYFPITVAVNVGIMCASPEGGGFECSFDRLKLSG